MSTQSQDRRRPRFDAAPRRSPPAYRAAPAPRIADDVEATRSDIIRDGFRPAPVRAGMSANTGVRPERSRTPGVARPDGSEHPLSGPHPTD